jgi:hypothetical protein
LDQVFSDVKFRFVFHYLDDLVIYSDSFQQHLQHLHEVFTRLCKAGLTVNPTKVKFANPQLPFLGHIVSSSGVSVDPDRTEAIKNFPSRRDAKGIARFIGMVNFFHKFILHFAERVAPLNLLRRKEVQFCWSPDQQKVFDDLKLAITNPLVWLIFHGNLYYRLMQDLAPLSLSSSNSLRANASQ